ncbi:hypothetical protein ABID22_003618 [Pontibacter aydingkolensis]|uniref:T9SS type A sorting domain-containing protein n=1 Tax=Pontibacter aydingkolensis TaxID=1911536 RepID=A0ABS7CYN9_9BACT|nr:T9SS type A sorting domain-containing protein [Pontibacter aydingkolensis]MBW7468928.1 T9SS type A sorting domain-containing protein [Pontibacter aydingkolensis]
MKNNYTTNLLKELKPKMRYVLGCCLLFTASHTFAQNDPWIIYNANELPDAFTESPFVTASVVPAASETQPAIVATEQSIISDSNVQGNNLLSFRINGNDAVNFPHTTFLWRQNFPTTPASPTAATVVVRAKGLEGFDRVFELDLDFNGYRETVYVINATETNPARVTFNVGRTSNTTLENLSLGENFNTKEWHTYRFTKDGATIKLFIDESETPVATSTVGASTVRNYFRIGDGSSGSTNGSHIDYIMWTVEGAYSPAQKALPAGTLTKLKSVDAASAKVSVYPNPVKGGQASLAIYLQASSDVSVQIFDLAGRKVGKSINFANMRAGQNEVALPVSGLKEGTYIYQISTNRFTTSQKLFVK